MNDQRSAGQNVVRMSLRTPVPARSGRRRPEFTRAFTLVELLIVIGIIGLLMGLLLPALYRSKRTAAMARAQQDIQAIQMAVEAFQQAWGNYPASGSGSLFTALTTAQTKRAGSQPYGPFLDAGKFNTVGNTLNDSDGNPILYFLARSPIPDLTSASAGYVNTTTTCLYNQTNGPSLPLKDMQKILGDANNNGKIDPGEQAVYTGPFILWGAGPDGKYGFNVSKGKTDDVANFEIPGAFR